MNNFEVITALSKEGMARYLTGTVSTMLAKVGVNVDEEAYYKAFLKFLETDFDEENKASDSTPEKRMERRKRNGK